MYVCVLDVTASIAPLCVFGGYLCMHVGMYVCMRVGSASEYSTTVCMVDVDVCMVDMYVCVLDETASIARLCVFVGYVCRHVWSRGVQ